MGSQLEKTVERTKTTNPATIKATKKAKRGKLSNWFGVSEENSNGLFYSIKNANGGNVYVSKMKIDAMHLETIMKNTNGKVIFLAFTEMKWEI